MIYLGIDPGMSGGCAALLESGDVTSVFTFKDMTERDISDEISGASIVEGQTTMALIEKVHSMPKQGVASSFKFGMGYGFLRGLLTAHKIRFDDVTPQSWQKAMRCLTHGDKNVSKAMAQRLFPDMKVTHGIADALLIAEHARRTYVVRT